MRGPAQMFRECMYDVLCWTHRKAGGQLFHWIACCLTHLSSRIWDKVSLWLCPLRVRIGPFHFSWGWQVHTDLILSLENFARPHTRFICGSPTGLHWGDGWSGNRWRPGKHQQPELWVHLSIKSSTGYTKACSGSRLETINSYNWSWTPGVTKEGDPSLKTDGDGARFVPNCSGLGGHICVTCREDWMHWQGNVGRIFTFEGWQRFLLQ